MPSLPWKGYFIAVSEHGEVSWIRCVNCSRPLTDPASCARAVGPECVTKLSAQLLEEKRELALREDRQRWRHNLSPYAPRVALQQARDSRTWTQRMTPRTEEQERRWAILQEALARRTSHILRRQA